MDELIVSVDPSYPHPLEPETLMAQPLTLDTLKDLPSDIRVPSYARA
ncbi:MAG: hypothetical protein ACI9LZ_003448, partial [Glaciecola sp.]